MTVAASLPQRTAASFGGLPRYGRPAGMAALILLLGFLTLYPMVMLLYGSLHSTPPGIAGTFNLDGYASLATAENLRILANTVGISLVKTILSLVLAILLAWIVARTDTPGRGVLEVLDNPAVLHSADPDGDRLGDAGQRPGRHHQPGLAVAHRLRHHAGRRLFLWRRDLAHDAVLDAVHLPVRGRCLPRHGSRARGIKPHVGRHRAGRPSGASPWR